MNRKLVAGIILLIPFSYIYGLSFLSLFSTGNVSITPALLLFSLLMNLLVMGGSSAICIYVLYGGGIGNVFHKLYFKKEGTARSALMGTTSATIFLLFLVMIAYILQLAGYSTENKLANEIASGINLPMLFAVPFLSALSEEIFFRAFLQMRMAKFSGQPAAILVSSLLFGIAHLSYGNVLQVVVPFLFGIVLGYLMMKSGNIAAPFSAHFAFNFIQLAAVFLS